MTVPRPFSFRKWIDENRHLLKPPVGNQVVFLPQQDFIVMVVGGPNSRKDFHYNETEEFYYQLEGDIVVRIMEEGKPVDIPVKEGAGANPTATSTVKVHYHGTLRDGTVFDSSVQRGQPISFPLNGVIPCWTEGVQKMKVGGKAKLVCPSDTAYGDQGSGPIPGGATLLFEVELIAIEK